MNTVMASFDTVVRKMTVMYERKNNSWQESKNAETRKKALAVLPFVSAKNWKIISASGKKSRHSF